MIFPGGKSSRISTLEHWAFGITVVIGGQFFSWNVALEAGIGAFLLDYCLVGFGYFALCCCLGEMSSTLQSPFAGALFCFTRAAFGRTFGFFVAALEVLEYVGYVASTLLVFGSQLTLAFGTDYRFEPLWWLLFFVISLPVYLYGLNWFWKANVIFASLMVLQLVVYFILAVSTPECSISNAYSPEADNGFVGGWDTYASALPEVVWLFVGVEGLTLANEQLKNHQLTHRGMLACCLTLLVTALFSIFGTVTNPPGIDVLAGAPYPLNYVLQYYGASSRGAVWFSIIPTFATAFGFVFLYATLINSLARSAVIPEWLGNPPTEHPKKSMLAGSVLVYIITLIGWLSADLATITSTLFSVYQISAVTVYIVQMAAFVMMRTDFANLGRTWNSPLGIPGTFLGAMIFLLVLVCLVVRQQTGYKWIFFGVWFLPVTLYYYFWGQYAKPASEEEIRAMFRMHTMRLNHKRKHKHIYLECVSCHGTYCSGCRKKGSSKQRTLIRRMTVRLTGTEFKCFNCTTKNAESRRPRGSHSGNSGRRESSSTRGGEYEDSREEEELETILMARSMDKKCIVGGCGCRSFRYKSQRTCECGHLSIYHESTEEALGLADRIASWKSITDVAVLEEILGHVEKAKVVCAQTFDHRIESLKHRISSLKQQAAHEAKMADISKRKAEDTNTERGGGGVELTGVESQKVEARPFVDGSISVNVEPPDSNNSHRKQATVPLLPSLLESSRVMSDISVSGDESPDKHNKGYLLPLDTSRAFSDGSVSTLPGTPESAVLKFDGFGESVADDNSLATPSMNDT